MTMRALLRMALAAVLGLTAALLVACGGSGKGLIPAAQAGPLQSDFEAVAHAAESGDGSCAGTEAALGKTEKDFLALPATVDAGLRSRLKQGIDNLRSRALAMCAQPAPTVTTATTPTPTTETTTTPTTPTTTNTTPTPTPPPSEEGGGTAAPGEEGEGPGTGKGKGKGVGKDGGEGSGESESGGASAGGASPGAGQ
jgi:hypothetical protein